jgi:hypothetical protein
MTKEFVTYEQALALKELGFDEPCLGYYFGKDREVYMSNEYVMAPFNPDLDSKIIFRAPTYSQAFRWFREKYKLVAAITVENDDFDYTIYIPWEIKEEHDSTRFTSYEEAEQACLDKLIEICKNK